MLVHCGGGEAVLDYSRSSRCYCGCLALAPVGAADDCLDGGSQVHIPGCRGEVGRVVDARPQVRLKQLQGAERCGQDFVGQALECAAEPLLVLSQ